MLNKIVVTSDFEGLKTRLENELGAQNLRFFIYDDFLIENAREVVNEAYIAEVREKTLVIAARSFRAEAQNSLLKIIEEPPRNVNFIIAANSKNLLLPTIRSRMITENLTQKRARARSGLNIAQLDIKEIYEFLGACEQDERADKLGKNELKELISVVITEALEAGFKFSADELDYFGSLVRLAELNAKSAQLLTPLLLTILQKGRP